mmetsp:Transcript_41738/g.88941  ORF Transcript_41738/g.88941 Transcript_41738/m.88941 type:complete len:259 (-) Transcript_41738:11-787(-)
MSADASAAAPPLAESLHGRATRVSCVGDSITFGFHSVEPDRLSYPAQLQRLLGPGYVVSNFGCCGAMLMRAPPESAVEEAIRADGKNWYRDSTEHADSLRSEPDIVVIQLGTNDASSHFWSDSQEHLDGFRQAYVELIGQYRSLSSKPRVYVSLPPPVYIDGSYSVIQRVVNDVYPELIASIAQAEGLREPIPVFQAFRTHRPGPISQHTVDCDWIAGSGWPHPGPTPPYDDGLHPNKEGYLAIATVVRDYITSVEVI